MTGEQESVLLGCAKILFFIPALIFSVSYALDASELWQFITAALAALFGIVLLVSGVRDVVSQYRARQRAIDEAVLALNEAANEG